MGNVRTILWHLNDNSSTNSHIIQLINCTRDEKLVTPPDMSCMSPKQKVIILFAKPWADLQYSWVWGHSSAHAPCRESAPRSRPQPAAPRCCSRRSSRASSSARNRTVYAPRDPQLRGGLRSQNRQLQTKQSAKTRENEFVGFQHVCFFFVLKLLGHKVHLWIEKYNVIFVPKDLIKTKATYWIALISSEIFITLFRDVSVDEVICRLNLMTDIIAFLLVSVLHYWKGEDQKLVWKAKITCMLFNKIVAVELKKISIDPFCGCKHAGAQLLDLPAGLARTVSFVVMLRAAEF